MKNHYLGDGLYLDHDGYQTRLFTKEGQEVFLDQTVMLALLRQLRVIYPKFSFTIYQPSSMKSIDSHY